MKVCAGHVKKAEPHCSGLLSRRVIVIILENSLLVAKGVLVWVRNRLQAEKQTRMMLK